MATTEKIQIPVEAIDGATKPINEINRAVEGSGKAAEQANKKATFSFTELSSAIGIAQQGLAALKKGYDFAKEGATLEFTAIKFDRLAQSIGTTSDVLLNEMKKATKGTLSDMEAMAAATDLLSLGLAKTQDEAVRLATVQSGLAMDTNQLVLALSNQTTMRFDQLGLSVDGFDEKVKELEKTGLSANDAFKEAFLQQAEEQLAKVGNAADTSLGSFKRLEAQVKNISDTFKEDFAEGVAPLVKAFADSLEESERYKKALAELDSELLRQYEATGRITPEMRALVGQYERGKAMTELYNAQLAATTETTTEAVPPVQDLTEANKEWLSAVGSASDEMDSHQEKMAELSSDYDEATAKLADLTQNRWWDTAAIDQQKAKIDELRGKMEEETADYEMNSKRRILAGVEEQLAKDGLTEQETQRLEELGVAWGVYTEDAIAKAQAERKAVEDISTAINNLPEGKDITVTLNAIANIPGAIAGDPQAQAGGYAYQYGNQGYAEGGIARGPTSGHTELLHGDEAVIPLQNGSIPVKLQGNQGGMDTSLLMPFIERMGATIARSIRDEMQKAGRR